MDGYSLFRNDVSHVKHEASFLDIYSRSKYEATFKHKLQDHHLDFTECKRRETFTGRKFRDFANFGHIR